MGIALEGISQSSVGGLMEYKINPSIRTPYFLVDENLLLHNLEILKQVSQQTGCKILLAQKAFSMFSV